ncbi:MAG: biopolymer transporter ExbD [Verrucomicrobia bacterium RIFCSPLOWO2_12_FULL_64_8]|nr:MAG: biopolymer transporter ExbD [Verrucomicrobia bacterium RIFCSPLOWO2_12_FULL_64_8]
MNRDNGDEGTRITLRTRKKARIEIIPLIDVIFFLLATFVLFTLSLNRIQSVDVNLPVASDKVVTQRDPDPPVTLQVSDQGNLFWNREVIDIDDLPSYLIQYRNRSNNPRILIAGDDKARWGVTVAVLDEVRKAQIEKVSMETRTRPTGR